MTLFRSVADGLAQRSVPNSMSALELADALGVTAMSAAGVPVNRDTAMRLTVVHSSVRLIAETIAALPVGSFVRDHGTRVPFTPRPTWLDTPNAESTRIEVFEQLLSSDLLDGNAYGQIVRDRFQEVQEIWPLDPHWVMPFRDPKTFQKRFDVAGSGKTMTEAEILHIPAFRLAGQIKGLSPIEYARQTIGIGLAAEEVAARYYGQGIIGSGTIEVEGELSPEAGKRMARQFAKLHAGVAKSHLPIVLEGGAKYSPIAITPEQMQFLETRKYSVVDIARLFRVPPHLVGDVERSTSWGTGIEEQAIGFVVFTLKTWLERFEQRLSRLFGPSQAFVKFNVAGLLRGDTLSRYEAYVMARNGGWLSVDEIRALEDLAPLANGQGNNYIQPLNMGTLGADASKTKKKDQAA